MDRKERNLRVLQLSLIVAGLFILSSCEKYVWAKTEVPQDLIVSYTGNIYPFCNSCHGAWSDERVYEKLSANVDTVTPASSRVLSIHSSITAFGSQMVLVDTVLLSAPDMIKLWASQGADKN